METLSNETVHASISVAPNNAQIDVQNTEELSKEKEEELLYGTGEDGDEEEALSDDSLRLRLSDDEPEIEDITPECTNTPHSKQQTKDMDTKSKVECAVNLQPSNETDTSKKVVMNKKNVNCKLTKMEDEISDVKINCNDSKSVDNLNDSKNLNNITLKEKEHQSSVKAPNREVDTNKEDDQCNNTKQDSILHKEEELLDSDSNTAILDHNKVQNSTQDKHSMVKNCEDKQEIDCTQNIESNKCQKSSENAAPITKNTRLSNIKNGKSKTEQENCLPSDQKVSNAKSDEKILDKKDDSFQTQNHCLKKQTEKLNSTKVITENNDIQNTNQSASEAINLDSDVNESVASNNDNSVTNNITLLESTLDIKSISDDNEKKSVEVPKTQRKRRRSRKLSVPEEDTTQENKEEVGRQKRRTAKNAEEIIRKKFLVHDSDIDSSDSAEKLVFVNHKVSQHMRSLSPPSLKRNCPDNEVVIVNGTTKKLKRNSELLNEDTTLKNDHKNDIKSLSYIHKFFRRDLKEKLPKLKQEELEELLIQKIVESITMRSEIGKLREQARLSEKSQEATRTKCQQLAKQIKDFEMVLNRHAADRRANNDKPTPPIKINRSVGLQVNFITDHGIQSLRQLQQNPILKSLNTPNASTSVNSTVNETNTNALSPRKGIKIRSPRRLETGGQPVVSQPVTVPQSSAQPPPLIPTVTPTALVVSKTVESQHSVNSQNQNNSIQQILPNQQQSLQPQAVVLNGKIPHQTNRQSIPHNLSKTKTNDLIDLTDEEEKSKSTFKNKPSLTITAVTTNAITDSSGNILSKAQPCFPRVIQTLPGNVAISSQPASIRVVHTASHPTPTALVNNMNASRLAYVMQGGVGSATQLLITSSTNQIRPVTSCTRPPFTTVAYKAGISTNANGTVRVITTSSGPNAQSNKHPAPLPDSPHYAINSASKLPPPAPSLKISKVANGIVLSWNMVLSDKYADIVSYQLYAYQEVAGVPPSTSLWKKVGDVRALPLPMACTLTQFSEGNNYYFAVRAVDTHSRKGQYSTPGNISL